MFNVKMPGQPVPSHGRVEALEPRRLLSVSAGEIITIEWDGHQVQARAGEWNVLLEPVAGGADDEHRSLEQPLEQWLAGALEEVSGLGITFHEYLGVDSMFSIRAPVEMAPTELTEALSDALPGFVTVSPNFVGEFPGGGSGAALNPTPHAEPPKPGDVITLEYNGEQVRAVAGEWIVRLEEIPGGATGERRSSEMPILPWLDQQLDAVRHLGIEFDQYIGRDSRFAIRAPVELTHAELEAALSVLPGFEYVQPNLAYSIAAARSGGNVQVVPTGDFFGTIEVIGDDEDNAIVIEPDGNGGWHVRGINGTTVNGGNEPARVFSEGAVPVRLNGGRDEVIIDATGASSPESFDIQGGDGDDSVLVRGGSVGRIHFDGGLGRDWLGIYDATIVGDLRGTGGGGRDTLEVRRTLVTGTVDWSDRSGPGGIFIEDSTFGDPSFGNVTFAIAQADASRSDDDPTAPFPVWVHMEGNTFSGPAALRTGPGNDTIFIRDNVFATGDIDLFTDEGDDEVIR